MSENLFQSGPWVGFYNYSPHDKHRMELDLAFVDGKLSGVGTDGVGRFHISGGYDPNTLECSWIKSYVGAHAVFYRGFREGKGIWGAWDIGPHSHGGFLIWPRRSNTGEERSKRVETDQPIDAFAEEVTLWRVGDEP